MEWIKDEFESNQACWAYPPSTAQCCQFLDRDARNHEEEEKKKEDGGWGGDKGVPLSQHWFQITSPAAHVQSKKKKKGKKSPRLFPSSLTARPMWWLLWFSGHASAASSLKVKGDFSDLVIIYSNVFSPADIHSMMGQMWLLHVFSTLNYIWPQLCWEPSMHRFTETVMGYTLSSVLLLDGR